MSLVVFDINRAKVDAEYRTQALETYKAGNLKISPNELKWLQEVCGTSEDNVEYNITDNQNEGEENKTNVERQSNVSSGSAKFTKGAVIGAAGVSALCGGYVALTAMGAETISATTVTVGSIGVAVACLTAIAVAAKYVATHPNKDVHEELETLNKAMLSDDVDLANALIKVQESRGEVKVLTEEAVETEEDVNAEVEAKEEELKIKQQRIDELTTKAESEEGLTEEERAELKTLTGEVELLKEEISALKDDGAEDVEQKEEDINDKQEDINNSDEVFKSVLDIANYAETFDEKAKEATDTEKTAQTLNAALGLGAAAAMQIGILGLTPAGKALQIGAAAAGAISAAGATEQNGFSKDIEDEINTRVSVQEKVEQGIEDAEIGKEEITDDTDVTSDIIDNLKEEEDKPTDEPDDDVPVDDDTKKDPDKKEDDEV